MVAHPADDRLFLSGSIEGRVRLWNVAEQRVVDDAAVHEMVSRSGAFHDMHPDAP